MKTCWDGVGMMVHAGVTSASDSDYGPNAGAVSYVGCCINAHVSITGGDS